MTLSALLLSKSRNALLPYNAAVPKPTGGYMPGTHRTYETRMVYRTYPRRWGVLSSVFVCNMAIVMIDMCLTPVAPITTKYYNIDGDTLDLIVIISNVLYFCGMGPAIYCVNTFGLQRSIQIGSTCVCIGSIIRLLSTFPSYEANMEPSTKWWLTLSGQVVIAIGHPFLMSLATKVSQAWFSEKERIFSTASIALSAPLGAMVGAALTPIIVNNKLDNIPYLNIYFPVVGVVGCILSWCFVTMPVPPSPPSASAEQDNLTGKEQLTFKDSLVTSKNLFKNPTIVCLMIVYGGGFGVFQTLNTQIAQIMCVNGYPRNAAGFVLGGTILAGLLGSVIIGSRARYRKRLEDFAKIFFCLFNISFIFLFLALREENVLPGIIIAALVGGFCVLGTGPLVFEMCAEEVYPVNPIFPETFIRVFEAIWVLILVPVCNALHWDPSPHMLKIQTCRTAKEEVAGKGLVPWDYTPYFYFIMALQTVGAVSFVCVVKTNMNRAKVDRQQLPSTEPQNGITQPHYVNKQLEQVN